MILPTLRFILKLKQPCFQSLRACHLTDPTVGNLQTPEQNVFRHFQLSGHGKIVLPDKQQEISFPQLSDSVSCYATWLVKENVQKGDRIVSQVTKSVQNICLYLACLKLGVIYVPLNVDYKLAEVRYFVKDATPRLLVCQAVNSQLYSAQFTDCAELRCVAEELIAQEALKLKPTLSNDYCAAVKSDDIASITYTSGTTGKPKGAMITHENLLSNAQTLTQIWQITSSDVLLHCLPLFHVHGLFVALNTSLIKGASIWLLPRFDVDECLRYLPSVSLFMGVPTFYSRLLSLPRFSKASVGDKMRLFISGSAPLTSQTWHEFQDRSGHGILERYGMTEGQMVCSNPCDGLRKPGTVGLPLCGVDVRMDAQKQLLEYKGPNVFKGYWNMPEKTLAEFTQDGYFVSGDVAEFDGDGYIVIKGRGKDLVISGGLNVYPKEVELLIDNIPGVQESAVIGLPHRDFGEAVFAVVVKRLTVAASAEDVSSSKIISLLKRHIATFKVPKAAVFVDELPRNAMGKVQKNVLRERYKGFFL